MNFSYGAPTGTESVRIAAGVGRIVRELREARGWTYADLRRLTGVNTSPWERGVGRPSWRSLQQVAAAFCPFDRARAEALAEQLARAAGPSLSAAPDVPTGLSRELVVQVLAAAGRRLGFDLDDDAVRHVVMEELRRLTGEGRSSVSGERQPEGPIRAEAALAINGKGGPGDD